jgi:hypothetical protein
MFKQAGFDQVESKLLLHAPIYTLIDRLVPTKDRQ